MASFIHRPEPMARPRCIHSAPRPKPAHSTSHIQRSGGSPSGRPSRCSQQLPWLLRGARRRTQTKEPPPSCYHGVHKTWICAAVTVDRVALCPQRRSGPTRRLRRPFACSCGLCWAGQGLAKGWHPIQRANTGRGANDGGDLTRGSEGE